MEGGEIKRTQNRKIANERKKPEEKSGGGQIFLKKQKIIVNIGNGGGEIKKTIYKEDLKKRKLKEKK